MVVRLPKGDALGAEDAAVGEPDLAAAFTELLSSEKFIENGTH